MRSVASLLLNCVYAGLLVALAPWLVYQAITKQKYRTGLGQKFFGRVPFRPGDRPCAWLHAVSVGEVNLLGTLLRELDRVAPGLECVISTTTITGYEVARKKYPDRVVFYCPLDFSWAVRAAMRRIRPSLLVLAELELWPNLIGAAREQGARVAVINGRLSDKSFRGYRRARPLVAWLLRQIDLIAVQDRQYAERFLALSALAERVKLTGSMKFDGARFDRENPATRELARLAGIEPDDLVFLAGSTGEPEEALALATYRELAPRFPKLRLIVVPRHPERFPEVDALLASSGVAYARRSQLGPNSPASRVLLVDTVGELGAWWGTADIAFVGGSLNGRGGQNMLEPSAFAAAVCFGPNTRNFRDIVAILQAADAIEVVADGPGLTRFVERCLIDPQFRTELGRRAAASVREQQGATARTAELLGSLLAPSSGLAAPQRHAA